MTHDVLVDLTPLDTASRHTGTGRYVYELGLALAGLDERERQGLSIGALTALEGPQTTGPLGWPGSPTPRYDESGETAFLMARRTRLPWTLRHLAPRLFHATYHMGTPRGSGVPRVVTCLDLIRLVLHDEYLAGRPVYRRVLLANEAARFHSARRVLAISEFTANDAMRLLGVPASKIDVALLGVDLDRYRLFTPEESTAAAAVQARYGLGSRPYLFYMGRADPRKNVDILIRAFARAALPDLDLAIIGPMRGSDQALIDRAMKDAGHPRGVKFLGLVPEEDLPSIIHGSLAFVFCSTYEGFGNVPIEAMACGCPVVHTGLTSMKETVADAGLLVPPRDVDATADAIRRLVREPSLRKHLAAAGHARAQRFSWKNTALATVDSYTRALTSSPSRS
jgi:glycosyltransferase involved in cell wall biosynthesis